MVSEDPFPSTFHNRLTVEILIGERFRTALLAGLFALILVGALVNTLADLHAGLPQIGGPVLDIIIIGISALYVVYELLMYRFIGRRLKHEQPIASWAWYFNAFLETSSPTIALYCIGFGMGNVLSALTSPLLMLYFIFILLSVLRLRPAIGLFTGAVAAVEYLGLSVFMNARLPGSEGLEAAFVSRFYIERSIFLLLAGVGAALVARELKRWVVNSFRASEDRRRIYKMFGQYTSPAIVDRLLRHGWDLESQRRIVCVMFLDIRGFTTYAERHSPEEVVDYLNRLLEFMIEVVNANHGIVHQLLGDGFMAVFGAPVSHENDVQYAVEAARTIVSRLEEKMRAGELPPTRVGIGLHVGEAVAGPVGSSIHKEYKVTGDVVNVAARIEALNKRFNSQILVSGDVWSHIRDTVPAIAEYGPVQIPGRSRPLTIYQLA